MIIGAIIFSRFSSKRLPGKALIDVQGRELLGRVIDKSKSIKNIDKIIIATSLEAEDDVIVEYAKKENIQIFRGSLNNVAHRALSASKKYKLDSFVRICGDRPFMDPEIVTDLVNIQKNLDLDLVTTAFPRTLPPGLTVEIVKTAALERAVPSMVDFLDREHITSYFYKNFKDFSIKNIDPISDLDFKGINLCMDTEDDQIRLEWIARHIDKKGFYAKVSDLIHLAKEWERYISGENN